MSKGLGKLQQDILRMLREQEGNSMDIYGLVRMVHFDEPHIFGDCDVSEREQSAYNPPDAFYQSITRAVRSLRKRGLVSTKRVFDWSSVGGHRGGRTYNLNVKSLVQCSSAKNSTLIGEVEL